MTDVSQYIRILRRWGWMIVTFAVISAATAAAVSLQLPRLYQSQTTALVNPSQSVIPSTTGVVDTAQLVQTYVDLIDISIVRKQLTDSGVPRTPGQLAGEIVAKQHPGTTLVDITVTDPDPQVAFLVAQRIIRAFNGSLDKLQSEVNGANPSATRLQALVPAEVPTSPPTTPITPNTQRNILLAIAAGLTLGAALALLFEFLDNTVKSEADVRTKLDMTLIGAVHRGTRRTRAKNDEGMALITVNHPKDPLAESYRGIRTNLQFSLADKGCRTLLVTSTIPGEGKTSTASNIAVVMAQSGKRVILVDADFRRPDLHKVFRVGENLGLGNLIVGQTDRDRLIQQTKVPNLRVVCSGPTPPNPSELLGSERMGIVLEMLIDESDMVILDTPPLSAVTDAAVLASRVDAVLLVVERGRTAVPAMIKAREVLQAVHANILGVVLNKVTGHGSDYYYYSYSYADAPPSRSRDRSPRQQQRTAPRMSAAVAESVALTEAKEKSGASNGHAAPTTGSDEPRPTMPAASGPAPLTPEKGWPTPPEDPPGDRTEPLPWVAE